MPDSKPKIYIKDESFDPIYKSVSYPFVFKSRILSGSLMALGFLILGTQVVLPLVSFKTQDTIAKPIEGTVLGVATGFKDYQFNEMKTNDSNISNEQNVPDYFYITIPKLGIEDAKVKANFTGLNPDSFIGHYRGSPLPGDVGNAYIFGHSVLPWFFNPKNYKTIFANLGNLEPSDTFTINYNNKTLKYKVESKIVLKPNDVKPIEAWAPKYLNESTVTLMTCWPAGTKTNRLEIRAILQN